MELEVPFETKDYFISKWLWDCKLRYIEPVFTPIHISLLLIVCSLKIDFFSNLRYKFHGSIDSHCSISHFNIKHPLFKWSLPNTIDKKTFVRFKYVPFGKSRDVFYFSLRSTKIPLKPEHISAVFGFFLVFASRM